MGAVSVNALCLTQQTRLRRYRPRLVVTRTLQTHCRRAALKERGGATKVCVLSSLSGVPSLRNWIGRTGDGYTLDLCSCTVYMCVGDMRETRCMGVTLKATRLLSHVSCLMSHVSCLMSHVSCLMSRVILSLVTCLMSRVSCDIESNKTLVSCLMSTVRFSTSAKKALPRNTDFICGNKKRTANPHKCTLSCGIGRDFHI
jgi:hypothetical protein